MIKIAKTISYVPNLMALIPTLPNYNKLTPYKNGFVEFF